MGRIGRILGLAGIVALLAGCGTDAGQGALDDASPPTGDATTAPEWTAGIVEAAGTATGQVTLNDIRTGRHEGYDRVTFELDGLPDYHLEYVDRPVRQCGSGHVVEVAGDGWLRVRLHSARAHTEAGHPTIDWRERRPDLAVILEIERICDFEGEVSYVIGVRSPNPFRVLTLDGPPRLVVDIRS